MDDQVFPLWVFPWPVTAPDMALLRRAKDELKADFKIIPKQAQSGADRVLALREEPGWFVDFALIPNPNNLESLRAGMEWALTSKVDSRATTALQWLQKLIPGVKELTIDQVAYKDISMRLNLDNSRKKVRR